MLIMNFAILAYGALITITPLLVHYLKASSKYYALVYMLGYVLMVWLGLQ